METVKVWLEERIGNPDLLKKELSYFLRWIDRTKEKISQSTAILSRRNTGKTALLQRLFNITFEKNDSLPTLVEESDLGLSKSQETEKVSWNKAFSNDIQLLFQNSQLYNK